MYKKPPLDKALVARLSLGPNRRFCLDGGEEIGLARAWPQGYKWADAATTTIDGWTPEELKEDALIYLYAIERYVTRRLTKKAKALAADASRSPVWWAGCPELPDGLRRKARYFAVDAWCAFLDPASPLFELHVCHALLENDAPKLARDFIRGIHKKIEQHRDAQGRYVDADLGITHEEAAAWETWGFDRLHGVGPFAEDDE